MNYVYLRLIEINKINYYIMNNYLLNCVCILIFIIIFVVIYYKIKYRFWSIQPVFHYHNLFYWTFNKGIINQKKPIINKFYDIDITTINHKELDDSLKNLIYYFIVSHFLPHKFEKYNPPKNGIFDYFEGHNESSYFSIKYETKLSRDRKNTINNITSVMTSKPMDCIIDKEKMIIDYVDFLCVHKNKRKMGIAPKTIYSHVYNQSVKQNKPIVYLFKREGATTLIVPITKYGNYMFDTKYWTFHKKQITQDSIISTSDNTIKTILINDGNFSIFLDLFNEIEPFFECLIYPNIQNIKHLCKTGVLFITVLLKNNVPKSFYVFRNNYTTYNDQKSIECLASFSATSELVFIEGFINSLKLVYERKLKFRYLFVENISNNNYVIKNIIKRYDPLKIINTSYYFYNMAHRPIKSESVFFIN